MTPYINPATDMQRHFNKMHAKTRSKVERCIGVLKNRFRCLLGENQLLYKHEKCSYIIVSCVVLHNYLISHGEQFEQEEFDNDEDASVGIVAAEINTGIAVRDALASHIFAM